MISPQRKFHAAILFFLIFIVSSVSLAQRSKRPPEKSNIRLERKIELDFRVGHHLQPVKDLSTARTGIGITQKIKISSMYNISLAGRYENEAVYSIHPNNYPQELRETDTHSAWITDTYVKLNSPVLIATIGYQQVVWGETFGNNVSDIVNPRDLRELSLETPSRSRLQVPMINLQKLTLNSSFQLIYIPEPQFNRMPKIGSEFAIKLPQALNTATVELEENDPEKFRRGELGVRVSKQFSNLDVALFFFDYVDRMPVYELAADVNKVNTFRLIPHHRPLKSYGLNMTYDFDGYLFRGESVYSPNKNFGRFSAFGTSEVELNELNCIAGLDFPPLDNLAFRLQYSEKLLQNLQEQDFLPFDKRLDLSVTKNFNNERTLDTVISLDTIDGSGLYQLKYGFPIRRSWQLELRADVFGGSADSFWGQFVGSSRAVVTLKGNWQ